MLRSSKEDLGQITTEYGPSVGVLKDEEKCDPSEDVNCRPKKIDKACSSCKIKTIWTCHVEGALCYIRLDFHQDAGVDVSSVTTRTDRCKNVRRPDTICSSQ